MNFKRKMYKLSKWWDFDIVKLASVANLAYGHESVLFKDIQSRLARRFIPAWYIDDKFLEKYVETCLKASLTLYFVMLALDHFARWPHACHISTLRIFTFSFFF